MGSDYRCNQCNYVWNSKKSYGKPPRCPKCNSQNIRMDGRKFYAVLFVILFLISIAIFTKNTFTGSSYFDIIISFIILFVFFYVLDRLDKKVTNRRFEARHRKL